MAKKGILITGGSGLVGAYAVGMLLDRGERPVVFDVALNERLLSAVGVDVGGATLALAEGLVVKNNSKIRNRTSAGTPRP